MSTEKLYVKAVFPMVLGNRYEAKIVERFATKKEAEASTEPGEVMTKNAFDTKNKSWSKKAIVPKN